VDIIYKKHYMLTVKYIIFET